MTLSQSIDAATRSFDAENGTAVLHFSGDETFFRGHFPGNPVLPAMVQIAATVHLTGRMLGRDLRLVEVTRAKFTSPTGPGRDLTVEISTEAEDEGRTRVKALIREHELEVAELYLRVL